MLGELAGIGASCCWATGALIFSRVAVPAFAINLFKNLLGSALLLATLAVVAALGDGALLSAGASAWGWLAISGVAGLVIGDTCYFRSLQILGPRRGLVLTTLAPPLTVVLSWAILSERPTLGLLLGMAVTLAGVVVVILERGASAEAAGHFPGSVGRGVFFGLLGAAGQALGGVWSKLGMFADEPAVPTLEASFIRLVTAALIGLVMARFAGQLGPWRRAIAAPGIVGRLVPASFAGTYLGIWLSLVAYKEASSLALAMTLTSLTPVVVLPLVAVFLRQRISPLAVLGALVAVAGVALLFVVGPSG